MLTDRVLVGAIAMARAAGVPVIVDPKRRDFSLYAGADVIKPNRAELAAASGLHCHTDEEVARAAELVMREIDASLLVTRADKGMSYFSPGAVPIHMPTRAKLVFDVSGAGDAVMATFAYGLVGRLPIEQTMRLANLSAGIVVSKPGTATITLDELRTEAALHEEAAAFRKGGLASVDEARAIREHWAGRVCRSVSPMAASIFCIPATSRYCGERPDFATDWWSASIRTSPLLA